MWSRWRWVVLGVIASTTYLIGNETGRPPFSQDFDGGDPPARNIIGGFDADWGAYPWMGALVVNDSTNARQFCGCTAIDRYWVLTAGHCVDDGTEPDDFKVLFGAGPLGNDPSVSLYKADAIVMHPDYSSLHGLDYDLALVRLKRPLPETMPILPLISDDSLERAGSSAKVLGWGWTSADHQNPGRPSFLQEANVQVISLDVANSSQYFGGYITENMLPAGSIDPFASTHFGDSGGPLMGYNSSLNRWEQLGTLSFGSGCNKPNNPIGGFTRISRFKPWIEGIISGDFFGWMRGYGIDAFDHDDGDDNAPLLEYVLSLDPTQRDSLNWNSQFLFDPDDNGDKSIILPVRLRQDLPRLGFQFERSSDLKAWNELELPWHTFGRENYPESREVLYRVPLASMASEEGFYRLTHQDYSGILHGPYPLRAGSIALGQFNHELDATGITRYDYLIEYPGALDAIQLTVVSDLEWPIRLRVVDMESGATQLDVEGDATLPLNGPSLVSGRFTPVAGTQYLARVESTQQSHAQTFKISSEPRGIQNVLVPGSDIPGALSGTDMQYKRSDHYADTYQLQLEAETIYGIVVKTTQFDPILIIRDNTTLEQIQEVDERRPGVAEQVFIQTGPSPNVEVTVSSFESGVRGDYTIEVDTYSETDSIELGKQTIGFFNSTDTRDVRPGETYYRDTIALDLGNSQSPVTVYVRGFQYFYPTFGVVNVTDNEPFPTQRAWCEDRFFTFEPEAGKNYEVVIIARSSQLGENYHLAVFTDTSTTADRPNLSTKPQAPTTLGNWLPSSSGE